MPWGGVLGTCGGELSKGLRPDMNLELGESVVMPNHIHGIIIIGANEYNSGDGRDAMHRVSTNTPTNTPKNQIDFAWQPRFHEYIIRSPDDYDRVSKYITHNPENWNWDE